MGHARVEAFSCQTVVETMIAAHQKIVVSMHVDGFEVPRVLMRELEVRWSDNQPG